jgi:fatty acyl-CoA reductase
MMANRSIIEESLDGRQIFLTGATGMLGTSLVLKLIKDTNISTLHVLVRGGEGTGPLPFLVVTRANAVLTERYWTRMQELLPCTAVKKLQASNKIEVLEGDITLENFGLTTEALELLRENVSVYIHSAASLNLRSGLPKMASVIIHPSLAAARMALSFKNLERFVFVSTAYVNGFLHWQVAQDEKVQDCVVEERIYPLHKKNSDHESAASELKSIVEFGTTPEYTCLSHPYAYAYAKHLTERLLLELFSSAGLERELLLFRPSCFGPAEKEPFEQFEVSGSAPLTTIICATVATAPGKIRCKTNLADPSKITLDEVPVDVVVNRLVAHLAFGSHGCVHAVSGASHRRSSMQLFEAMNRLRGWWWLSPVISWCDPDTSEEKLSPTFKFCRVFGCSYLFQQQKTEKIWQLMDDQTKQTWPLWTKRDPADVSDIPRRGRMARGLLVDWFRRKYGLAGRWFAMLAFPEPHFRDKSK